MFYYIILDYNSSYMFRPNIRSIFRLYNCTLHLFKDQPEDGPKIGITCSWNYNLIYLLTYLLTPWCRVLHEKLTGLQLVKKFPRISRNPKVHYRTHKRPPPVSILGQPNPVHIPTSHLLDIHLDFIHPSTPRSPQWSLPLRFQHQ